MMLRICEIFRSIQGESTRAGTTCAFVRLSGCNLSCTYCDTRYAHHEGVAMDIGRVLDTIEKLGCPTVEITGGEPLLQSETPELCRRLLGKRYTVLVETNGALDIGMLPDGCIRIVDIKTPASGAGGSFRMENLAQLRATDECKMVLTGRGDFDWAVDFVRTHRLCETCPVLFAPAAGLLAPASLAEWILTCDQPVRLGLQLQKIIWGDECRGV
jgi:7-carboxy-7-deazaguanine synthase